MATALPRTNDTMFRISLNSDKNNHRLNNALKHWQQWCSELPTVIRKLEGGLTNEAYLIQSQDKHYVLRLNTPNSKELGLNRECELQALTLASKAGIAPKIIYSDTIAEALITEFLPGDFWQEKNFSSHDNIHYLVKLLKSIHQLPAINDILETELKAAKYWQSIDEKTAFTHQLKKLEPQIQVRIQEAQSLNSALCLCHNDLLASNLVTMNGNELLAIDWEYAAMGDPFFDLAVIAEGNNLDNATIKRLLVAYIGYDNDIVCNAIDISNAEARLTHSRIIYCYLDILWYAVQQSHNPSAEMQNSIEYKLNYLQDLL